MRIATVALLLSSISGTASAQDCDAILKAGIYNVSSAANQQSFAHSVLSEYCTSSASSFEAGITVEAVPLTANTSSDSSVCRSFRESQAEATKSYSRKLTINDASVAAWSKCMHRIGLHASVSQGSGDAHTFTLAIRRTSKGASQKDILSIVRSSAEITCEGVSFVGNTASYSLNGEVNLICKKKSLFKSHVLTVTSQDEGGSQVLNVPAAPMPAQPSPAVKFTLVVHKDKNSGSCDDLVIQVVASNGTSKGHRIAAPEGRSNPQTLSMAKMFIVGLDLSGGLGQVNIELVRTSRKCTRSPGRRLNALKVDVVTLEYRPAGATKWVQLAACTNDFKLDEKKTKAVLKLGRPCK